MSSSSLILICCVTVQTSVLEEAVWFDERNCSTNSCSIVDLAVGGFFVLAGDITRGCCTCISAVAV